jgi:hypothetical protein
LRADRRSCADGDDDDDNAVNEIGACVALGGLFDAGNDDDDDADDDDAADDDDDGSGVLSGVANAGRLANGNGDGDDDDDDDDGVAPGGG